MRSARQTGRIFALAALLCVVWAGVVRWLPRPELAETNYVANRLRIERWLLDAPASNVIVGTSISGRLLPAYFAGTTLASLANLGLDGGNPETGLTLVLNRPTAPALVFLEVHRLRMPPSTNDAQLLGLEKGPGLELGRYVPLTRAAWRPSTVLYGWLKSLQSGGASTSSPERPETIENSAKPDPHWVSRIQAKVNELQARGTRVYLVQLPVGRENPADETTPNLGAEAASLLNLPLLDLYHLSQRQEDKVTYTDGLHLSPSSAAQMAQLLAESVRNQSGMK